MIKAGRIAGPSGAWGEDSFIGNGTPAGRTVFQTPLQSDTAVKSGGRRSGGWRKKTPPVFLRKIAWMTAGDLISSSLADWPEAQPNTNKHMKMAHILTAIFSLLLATLGFAQDAKKSTTYAVGMTGVT